MRRKETCPEISCLIEPKEEGNGNISVDQITSFNFSRFNFDDSRMAMGMIYTDREYKKMKKEVSETPLP